MGQQRKKKTHQEADLEPQGRWASYHDNVRGQQQMFEERQAESCSGVIASTFGDFSQAANKDTEYSFPIS